MSGDRLLAPIAVSIKRQAASGAHDLSLSAVDLFRRLQGQIIWIADGDEYAGRPGFIPPSGMNRRMSGAQ